MSKVRFDISHFGEKALLIKIMEPPSTSLLDWILFKSKLIKEIPNVEVVHTYTEMLVKSLEGSLLNETLKNKLKTILKQDALNTVEDGQIHQVPVCYHPSLGKDLETYAQAIDLSIPEIIRRHTTPTYLIYFLGFLPGFPYLLGLDSKLPLARKKAPSRKTDAGSVGIGGDQTGIYPQESPGGWHIIGKTPLSLFDVKSKNPTAFKAGDKLQFYAISREEYESIKFSKTVD